MDHAGLPDLDMAGGVQVLQRGERLGGITLVVEADGDDMEDVLGFPDHVVPPSTSQ